MMKLHLLVSQEIYRANPNIAFPNVEMGPLTIGLIEISLPTIVLVTV